MEVQVNLTLLVTIGFHSCGKTGFAKLGFLLLSMLDLAVNVLIDPVHIMFPDLLQLTIQRADVRVIPQALWKKLCEFLQR